LKKEGRELLPCEREKDKGVMGCDSCDNCLANYFTPLEMLTAKLRGGKVA